MKHAHSIPTLLAVIGSLGLGACDRIGWRQLLQPSRSTGAGPRGYDLGGAAASVATAPAARPAAALPRTPEAQPGQPQTVHFARPEEAEALRLAVGGEVIDVEVGCCHPRAVDFAVGDATLTLVTSDLPNSAPVFVRSANPENAVAVAAQLAAAGLSQVFVITP